MVISIEIISKMSTPELMKMLDSLIKEQDVLLKRQNAVYKKLHEDLVDLEVIEPPPEKCPLCGQPKDCECKNCGKLICDCAVGQLCAECIHAKHMAEYRGENKINPDREE
jgi:hypothetical protein